MLNIGIVSQARLGSSRLPAKVLMTAGGKTLLEWHFERLAQSGYRPILATTTREEDDPLVEWAAEVGIDCFRGSEENVLSRYRECARQFKLDVVVRVTSDCPLIDGELVAAGINQYLAFDETRQYLTNGQLRTFPRGFDFEVFSRELLEEAHEFAVQPWEFEHVTPYFYLTASDLGNPQRPRTDTHHGRMDIALRHFTQVDNQSHLRVTVDTIEDFELVRRLIEEYDAGQKNHRQITEILVSNPQLAATNQHVEQKRIV